MSGERESLAELAAGLRRMRDLSGLSLKALERRTHASDSALSRYLSGRALAPWPVVEALCRAVGRDPGELRPVWEAASRERSSAAPRRPSDTPAPPATVGDPPPWRSFLRRSRWAAVFALGLGAGLVAARLFWPAPTGAAPPTGPAHRYELTLYTRQQDGRLRPLWSGGGACPRAEHRVPQNLPPEVRDKATSYVLTHSDCPVKLFESPDGGDYGERLLPDGIIHTLTESAYRHNSSVVAYLPAPPSH